jgi:hypothetical protein
VNATALPCVVPLHWSGADGGAWSLGERPLGTATATATRLDARTLQAVGARSAEERLRQVPGMVLVQHGSEGKGYQYFLRGFDAVHGADLLLRVEGIPLNELSHVHAQGYLDLGLLVGEAMQGVTVQRGPFDVAQAPFAMAGSVDIALGLDEADRGWRAGVTLGTTWRRRLLLSWAPEDPRSDAFAAVEVVRDDGFGQNRALDRVVANARAPLVRTPHHRLDLLVLGGHAAFGLPGTVRNEAVRQGELGFLDSHDLAMRGTSTQLVGALHHRAGLGRHRLHAKAWSGWRDSALTENFTGFLRNPVQGDRRRQTHRAARWGVDGGWEAPLAPAWVLRSGAGARGDALAQTEQDVDQALEPFATRRNLQAHPVLLHTLAGATWTPHARVQVEGGGRLDAIAARVDDRLEGTGGGGADVVVSPRGVVRWQALPALALVTGAGTGVRPPEVRAWTDLDPGRLGLGEDVQGTGRPAFTRSRSVDAGVDWQPAAMWRVQAAGFGTWIDREQLFDHVSGLSLELNPTRRLGGEVMVEARHLTWLVLQGDLTRTDARFTGSGRPVPLVSPWVGGLRGMLTHPAGWRAGARLLGLAPRPLPHGATGSTLLMLDLHAGWHRPGFRVDLEVENALNRELREGEYHYASHWRPGEAPSLIPVLHTTAGTPVQARLTLTVLR